MLGVNVAKLICVLFCVLFNNTVSNGDNKALVIDECVKYGTVGGYIHKGKLEWSNGKKFSPLSLEIVRRLESGER